MLRKRPDDLLLCPVPPQSLKTVMDVSLNTQLPTRLVFSSHSAPTHPDPSNIALAFSFPSCSPSLLPFKALHLLCSSREQPKAGSKSPPPLSSSLVCSDWCSGDTAVGFGPTAGTSEAWQRAGKQVRTIRTGRKERR